MPFMDAVHSYFYRHDKKREKKKNEFTNVSATSSLRIVNKAKK